jgi:predicted nucleotidyltransferase
MRNTTSSLKDIFQHNADFIGRVCEQIRKLPDVHKIILFGSYAKGKARAESDIDLAVFFHTDETCLIEKYRQLTRICRNIEVDVQAQPFHSSELGHPLGIVEEIVGYGIELDAS